MKRMLIFICAVLLSGLVIFLLRFGILRMLGNYLIAEDRKGQVDAIFVLSGASQERGFEAARLVAEGYSDKVYTTGAIINPTLKAVGIDSLSDAVITRDVIAETLVSQGITEAQIRELEIGTSTYEESEGILGFSRQAGFKQIMVVSSKFHTRRIRQVFRKKFKKAGIQVLVRGAPPLNYSIDKWWNSEEGLMFVNNEYVKMVYYMLKY